MAAGDLPGAGYGRRNVLLRRLQQLDSFLENGLIDRKEYNVLRAKYERYMRENENS